MSLPACISLSCRFNSEAAGAELADIVSFRQVVNSGLYMVFGFRETTRVDRNVVEVYAG